ncbi:MAG: translation initiation factor IF-3 [Kiritimatiellae bacterium]|nr:translation initiation factor IF-3 [Kiritimatiellia bacterium]
MRVNHAIRVPEVRCVDEDGGQLGVMSTRDALVMAQQRGLDLIEISPTAKPPVCKIAEYGKYKYEMEKKEKAARKHQSLTRLKEIKFHANTGEHDYQTKIRHALDFLEEGHRVKFSLFFRGRENAHPELGFDLMNRVINDCQVRGTVEQTPRRMGRSLIMMMCPRPGSVHKESPKPAEAARNG